MGINQTLTYLLSKAIGSVLVSSTNIQLQAEDISPDVVYVVASNHQSRIDVFMVSGRMSLGIWSRLLTFRYFVHNPLLKVPIVGPILLANGCFPSKPNDKHPSGLDYAMEQVALGRTIYIFPEGRRTLRGEHPARRGVSELARVPNVMIIPAHIEWHRKGWLRSFQAGIGKPFDGSKLTAQEILDRIYKQPVA